MLFRSLAGRHIRLDKDAMNCLARNPWPGNVRELANLLERLGILFPEQTVTAADLPERYRNMGAVHWFASGGARLAPVAQAVAPPAIVDALLQGVHTDSIDARPIGTLPLGADDEDSALCDANDEDAGAAIQEFAEVAELVGIQLPRGGIDLKDHLSAIEVGLIRKALKEADGTVAEAARLLRMRRTTLVEKLRKYRLSA